MDNLSLVIRIKSLLGALFVLVGHVQQLQESSSDFLWDHGVPIMISIAERTLLTYVGVYLFTQ